MKGALEGKEKNPSGGVERHSRCLGWGYPEGGNWVSRSSEAKGDTEKGQKSFGHVKAPPQKRRAVAREELVETQDYVLARPLTSCTEQKMEVEDEKNMEELSFVTRAPRWALHMCDNNCKERGFKFFQIAAVVSEEGGAAHTINLCRNCYNERRVKQGETEVTGALFEQKAFRGKLQRLVWNSFCEECRNDPQSKMVGPERFWKMQQMSRDWGQTASGHTKRRAWRRSSANAPSLQCGEVSRLGKLLGSNLGKWQAQRMGKCEGERMLQ